MLDRIGKSKNVSLTQIALAYVIAKQPYVFPIVGIRKVEHLQDSINALSIRLTNEEIKQIEEAYKFQVGFPLDFIGGKSSENWLLPVVGHYDWVEPEKVLMPVNSKKIFNKHFCIFIENKRFSLSLHIE